MSLPVTKVATKSLAAQKSLNMSWNVGGLVPSGGMSVVNNYYNGNRRTVNQ